MCFVQVLELEGKDKGEWGFKALKQMIKINFKLVSFSFGKTKINFHFYHTKDFLTVVLSQKD